jgi:hypothetical protein
MITKLVDALFGCGHNRYSFPITIRSRSRNKARPSTAASLTGMYVVCMDCGRELPYDWQEMKVIGTPSEARLYARNLAAKQAA